MPIDTSAITGIRNFRDFQREEEEFQMRKQLANAQVKKALQESNELDIKTLGENAFLKIGQGLPLTPKEEAAARFLDAKSGGIQFDPSTGSAIKKPSLFDKMPLPNFGAAPPTTPITTPINRQNASFDEMPRRDTPLNVQSNVGPYEAEYRRQLMAAEGNPKLQQSIKTAWVKSTMEPTADEMKAAGFIERMKESDVIVGRPSQEAAATDPFERMKASIPLLGNYIVSDDFQSFNQAQRDFINAQLRRESGAVISSEEFANARQQYFPAPGDTKATLAQKKRNREAAVKNMLSSAGAAYEMKNKKSLAEMAAEVPLDLQDELDSVEEIPTGQSLFERSKSEFDAKKPKRLKFNPATGRIE